MKGNVGVAASSKRDVNGRTGRLRTQRPTDATPCYGPTLGHDGSWHDRSPGQVAPFNLGNAESADRLLDRGQVAENHDMQPIGTDVLLCGALHVRGGYRGDPLREAREVVERQVVEGDGDQHRCDIAGGFELRR